RKRVGRERSRKTYLGGERGIVSSPKGTVSTGKLNGRQSAGGRRGAPLWHVSAAVFPPRHSGGERDIYFQGGEDRAGRRPSVQGGRGEHGAASAVRRSGGRG
ncbi:unnamed protein product, partial [Ectocarpus fasciculatus]